MKVWIIPSNDNIFRIDDAIREQDGLVDWRISNRYRVGDIVFIYKPKPVQCIRYKMEVVAVGLDDETSFYQRQYWTDLSIYFDGLGNFHYARFKLTEKYTDGILSLQHLQEHGLRGYLQGVRECTDAELLRFLLNPQATLNSDAYEVDYPADDEKLYEGALIKVLANKYERNQAARKKCIALKGSKCAICGFDFEAAYSEVGKGFIHVHHVVPISSIGKEYELDVEKDLLPVCPNCHYMLHRKDPPYTVEEMKRRLCF